MTGRPPALRPIGTMLVINTTVDWVFWQKWQAPLPSYKATCEGPGSIQCVCAALHGKLRLAQILPSGKTRKQPPHERNVLVPRESFGAKATICREPYKFSAGKLASQSVNGAHATGLSHLLRRFWQKLQATTSNVFFLIEAPKWVFFLQRGPTVYTRVILLYELLTTPVL